MTHTIKADMQELWNSSQLNGTSAAWLESLYEAYLNNPETVDPEWRTFFDGLPKVKSGDGSNGAGREVAHNEVRNFFRAIAKEHHAVPTATPGHDLELERQQVHVLQLINAYRFRGHQHAKTNPLRNSHQAADVPELDLAYHQLSQADFNTVFETGSLAGPETLTLSEIYNKVRETYCGSVGAEYMHIMETAEKRWIQHRLELTRGNVKLHFEEKINVLQQLTNAEGLEKYLHTKYVGQKRFSLEGGESLIPLLDELVMHAGAQGVKEVVIGMAHRGRLNVLVNILGKTPAELFSEFEGTKDVQELTGDVKYHLGFSSNMQSSGGPVHLALAFNPSHLEIVGPVVEGSVRARQWRRGDAEGVEVLPVQIHGDAAFAAQGVVMETLQMSQSRGFSTKGTIHIIVNNQIGFTTSYQNDARSTHYCTDVAKMVDAPIFHVNGDDPEAVIMVTRLALDYRMAFKKCVVIDMVCYRRHGHNEADEPKATQPMMYKKISGLPSTRAIYVKRLVNEGVLRQHQAEEVVINVRKTLESGHCVLPHKLPKGSIDTTVHMDWRSYTTASLLDDVETGVSIETIRELAASLEQLPEGFELQGRVQKIMDDRHRMTAGALPLDWGYAEIMAYATLVKDGYPVRLSGQDSGRGTFFHRHAVLHNQKDGIAFVPLRSIGKGKINFLVIDSLLSELAVLAFECGFSTADPKVLVIWEAQFGDFANGAQVVIDQFISAGEHKWGKSTGLVMLLPHGFEGQGAEHSSARIERFLQLCSGNNMQVCVPSTPAQLFHLLRRQMIRNCRKPLIVITPKSLLRHKECTSSLDELTNGYYKRVLPEVDNISPEKVKHIILCSGKVYYELLIERRAKKRNDIAIIRVEQLYPFPGPELNELLKCYTETKDIVWVQEEPKNQGAWDFIKPRIPAMLDKEWDIYYVGRESSSAPAVGSAKLHGAQQRELINKAINLIEIRRDDEEGRTMPVEVRVPALPESVADAVIASWHKQAGDTVVQDETLLDLETDKVILEVPAISSGVVKEICFNVGDTVTADQVLAIIDNTAVASEQPAQPEQEIRQQPAQAQTGQLDTEESEDVAISPSARKLMAEKNIHTSVIHGSGKGGRILKEDVLEYLDNKPQAQTSNKQHAEAAVYERKAEKLPLFESASMEGRIEKRVTMTRLRARIAERLLDAQHNAAILTTFNEVNMKPVMELRARYKERFEKEYGVKLGFMSFFVKASVEALKKFPAVNASIDGNDIVYHGYYDIGIAVSSPTGLVVPVLRNVEDMTLAQIEQAIISYAVKANENRLSIEDITGGTFTISNGGVFGSMLSTPILNPPQSGILGMHTIKQRPMVVDGEITVLPMMYLALSYDHRIIDGREAVQFLVTIKDMLEEPSRMLIGV